MLATCGSIVGEAPPKPPMWVGEGTIVSIVEIRQGRDGRLVMEKAGHDRYLFGVPAAAVVTLNNCGATLGDLKRDDRVVVAADQDAKAIGILATRPVPQ